MERFGVDLSCKTSDLIDRDGQFRMQDGPLKRDEHYDEETQDKEKIKEEEKKKQQVFPYFTLFYGREQSSNVNLGCRISAYPIVVYNFSSWCICSTRLDKPV